ncbi:selenocysteine-specific translation elongation factor [Thermodesulfobium narugense DSM 14796]|uniref:Selenocysteine-specific elongation factor n=1 Tax=Thermodesulfobium narugense DSM 14796 TaxID=747365 RepID=M1E4A1_9BACT|nr:selenocysteine-specific translation elongation factor [Thermodesulfobium narugense]AEE13882.1 selenocysteine-specific translation elongation factor [Thermodesulfobium narugense DSM 14796]
MRDFILGTAGHIDHGKTELIARLTGRRTERFPEERIRGMTIDIGFSSLELPCGKVLGIVDVPGHERFIDNMLVGSAGVDLALLVVAADEGIKEQTREHFEILKLLEVKDGLIVITKKDLVDEELLEYLKEEIKDFVKGSFLENNPIICASSVTGEGLEEILEVLNEKVELLYSKEYDDNEKPFRLFIDRKFKIKGFGLVVTGTVYSGSVRVGDSLEITPFKDAIRVKNLESHFNKVQEGHTGMRLAVNINTTLDENFITRGKVLVEKNYYKESTKFVGFLNVLDSYENLKNNKRVHLYVGSSSSVCRLSFEGSPSEGKMSYIVKLSCQNPVCAVRGDKFILRDPSAKKTLGGGIILDNEQIKLKDLSKYLNDKPIIDKKDLSSNIVQVVKRKGIMELFDLAKKVNYKAEYVRKFISETTLNVFENEGKVYLFSSDYQKDLLERLENIIFEIESKNPFQTQISKEEILKKLDSPIAQNIIDKYAKKKGYLVDKTYLLKERVSDEVLTMVDEVEKDIKNLGFFVLPLDELGLKYKDKKAFNSAIATLKRSQKIFQVSISPEIYIHFSNLEKLVNLLKEFFQKSNELSVSDFKDLTNTTRKFSIPLLEFCDKMGFTKRIGNVRQKGKKL